MTTRKPPEGHQWWTPGRLNCLGYAQMEPMFGVRNGTPARWQERRQMPEADGMVSFTPAWTIETMLKWARETAKRTYVDPAWLALHAPEHLAYQLDVLEKHEQKLARRTAA